MSNDDNNNQNSNNTSIEEVSNNVEIVQVQTRDYLDFRRPIYYYKNTNQKPISTFNAKGKNNEKELSKK